MAKTFSLLVPALFSLSLGAACIVVEPSDDTDPAGDDVGDDNDGDDNDGDDNGGDDNGGDDVGGDDNGGDDNGGGDNGGDDNGGDDNGGGPDDADGDGIPDIADNCPNDANPNQDITACTDVGSTCSENTQCDNNTCLKEVDDEGNWSDYGYCTIPCESFADCPSFWDCEDVGNALGTYCVQG